MCQIHEQLVKGELWAEVTSVTIWGHIKILPDQVKFSKTGSNRSKNLGDLVIFTYLGQIF